MAHYRVVVEKHVNGEWLEESFIISHDTPAVVKFLRGEAERIRKEPYMMPKVEGEEPLEGLA